MEMSLDSLSLYLPNEGRGLIGILNIENSEILEVSRKGLQL